MKKNLLVIAAILFSAIAANAQVCTPNPQFTQPGIYPDSATGLPDAYLNQLYSTVVTVVIPYDTTVTNPFPMTLKYDSIFVKNWNNTSSLNLPPNFTVACEPPGCVFPGAPAPGTVQTGCMLVTGMVNNIADTGEYNLFVDNLAYFTITNPPAGQTQSEDVDITYYSIDVKVPMQQVQISFTANPMNGCAPLTVDFTNTSTGAAYYQWYFDDGTDYFGFDTSHTFNGGGNYWVQVSAFDSNFNYLGNAYTIITVGGSAGYFEMAADSICPDDEVIFGGQDGAFDYQWNFGDGSFASGNQWESHVYNSTGTFPVTLIVSTSCGSDTIVQNIFVGNNVTPETGIGIWPQELCPNQPGYFSTDALGNNYQWTFGDGSMGNEQYTMHSYTDTGIYNISCVVTNSCGNSSTSSGMVSVVSNAPFSQWGMEINYWPQPACPGTEIFFNAPDANASYVWNFGDSTPADTSATNDVQHSFSAVGTYNVAVNITSFCENDTLIFTTVIIDNNVPFNGWFDLNVYPSPACPGSTVYFDAWSNDAVSYQWNFGDGSSSANQSTNHIYPNTGNYNATLTMSNSCGNDTIIPFVVDINNNVIPDPNDYDYGVGADTLCSGDSVLFFIAPGNSGTYLWNFGDGSSTTTSFPYSDGGFTVDLATHVYSNNGNYNVVFTLTNQCGNSFSDSFPVTIGSNVPVDGDMWWNGGESFCPGDTIKFNALGGSSYVWNFGDGSSPATTGGTITEIFHAYNSSGIYAVSVNITNSCGNSALYADTIEIDSCFVGLNQVSNSESSFNVYPNPNDGKFSIELPTSDFRLRSSIKIYNVFGELIFQSLMTNDLMTVDFSNIPSGIYFVQVQAGEKIYNRKIIVEN